MDFAIIFTDGDSLLTGWKARLREQLEDADSEYDKRDLSIALTVIKRLFECIDDMAKIKK